MASQQTTQSTLLKAYPWTVNPLIVSGPMRPYATAALATSVSIAGGIGMLSYIPKQTDKDLESAKSTLSSVHGSEKVLPLGVGYLIHSAPIDVARQQLTTYKPAVAWLFAPTSDGSNPQGTLRAWSSMVREASPDTAVWVQVGSLKDARQAIEDCAPSEIVLIAQGLDAGGHGLAEGAGIVTLVPEIRDAIPSNMPLLAAGGIMDGRGAAAALALGADGIILGTRMLCATETAAPVGFQEAILAASDGGQSTTRTTTFDKLRGTKLGGNGGWPLDFDGRGLKNLSSEEVEANASDFDEVKRKFDEMEKQGRPERFGVQGRGVTYAGTGVGLVRGIKPAKEIVEEVRGDAIGILQKTILRQSYSSRI